MAGEAIHNEISGSIDFYQRQCRTSVYPGSSLKGAIRTAIAAARLKEGNWSRDWRNIEQADEPNPRRYLKRETDMIERKIFFQLEHQDRNGILSTIRLTISCAASGSATCPHWL
jgi:CRISPR/Cas system CSM-associated protein Csm5 (group 7 of RAMP superfamily)